MKRLLVLLAIVALVSGCGIARYYDTNQGVSSSQENYEMLKKDLVALEKSNYVYEKIFKYSYKDVFLASLAVVHDWGANVYLKDYDNGIILIRPELEVSLMGAPSVSYGMPGIRNGLYFKKINDGETKITFRAIRSFTRYMYASAEDVFIAIEREIQFRTKITE